MKKLAMLITALALTLTLASCGGEDVNYAEMYDAVLQKYHAYLQAPKDYADDISVGVCEIALAIYGQPPLENIGYTIDDFSGDGIPELVICGLQDNTDDVATGSRVLAVYTLVDDAPTMVLDGWARNSYRYVGDGRFLNEGSNGASSSGCGIYKMSEDGSGFGCESFVFTDFLNPGDTEVSYFENTTGEWDKAVSDLTDAAKFESIRSTPTQSLGLETFATYALPESVG